MRYISGCILLALMSTACSFHKHRFRVVMTTTETVPVAAANAAEDAVANGGAEPDVIAAH